MSDATATDADTDVDPAALAALKHVGFVGDLSETKVSCAALADRLDASRRSNPRATSSATLSTTGSGSG